MNHETTLEKTRRILTAIHGQAKLLLILDGISERNIHRLLGMTLIALKSNLGYASSPEDSDKFTRWMFATLKRGESSADPALRLMVNSQVTAEAVVERLEPPLPGSLKPKPDGDRPPVIH